jgi:hypothetical protein
MTAGIRPGRPPLSELVAPRAGCSVIVLRGLLASFTHTAEGGLTPGAIAEGGLMSRMRRTKLLCRRNGGRRGPCRRIRGTNCSGFVLGEGSGQSIRVAHARHHLPSGEPISVKSHRERRTSRLHLRTYRSSTGRGFARGLLRHVLGPARLRQLRGGLVLDLPTQQHQRGQGIGALLVHATIFGRDPMRVKMLPAPDPHRRCRPCAMASRSRGLRLR